MFYKKINESEWLTATEIHFPDGTVSNAENRTTKDGFVWYDEDPQEYVEWKQLQINQIIN